MATTVVNLYHTKDYDVYCGRAGRGHAGEFGNPFQIGRDGDRAEVLRKFKLYFDGRTGEDIDFRRLAQSLKGKRLACFCRPKSGFRNQLLCHAQIIAAYVDGIKPEEVE